MAIYVRKGESLIKVNRASPGTRRDEAGPIEGSALCV
jgi:hypothetical protein